MESILITRIWCATIRDSVIHEGCDFPSLNSTAHTNMNFFNLSAGWVSLSSGFHARLFFTYLRRICHMSQCRGLATPRELWESLCNSQSQKVESSRITDSGLTSRRFITDTGTLVLNWTGTKLIKTYYSSFALSISESMTIRLWLT